MAEACGAEVTERLMLPTILTMATDLVANVRFNVAKTLTVLGPILTPAVMTSQVKDYLIRNGNMYIQFYPYHKDEPNFITLTILGKTNSGKIE